MENKQKWEPMFEPAKENEELPKEIWIPNRAERRKMKRHKNKVWRSVSDFYQEAIDTAHNHINQPDYKNEIYKALYEKTKQRREELDEELKKNGITTNQGNQDVES